LNQIPELIDEIAAGLKTIAKGKCPEKHQGIANHLLECLAELNKAFKAKNGEK